MLGEESMEAEKEYGAFIEKVKRTVYLDNLSPSTTIAILRTALEQFGSVTNAQMIPSYLEDKNAAICALVEMQSEREAINTVTEIAVNAFMIGGMPRPVRAARAEPEMFHDRPIPPGRRIRCCWIQPHDPLWSSALELKHCAEKHAEEAAQLLKYERAEEQKLSDKQEEVLRSDYRKHEMIEGVYRDGTAERLQRYYYRWRDF